MLDPKAISGFARIPGFQTVSLSCQPAQTCDGDPT